MSKPKVINYKHNKPFSNGLVVMRPSPFGNPFKIGVDGDRNEVCDKYEAYVNSRPDLIKRIKTELKGKNLICCCSPLRCHADTLLRIANELNESDFV